MQSPLCCAFGAAAAQLVEWLPSNRKVGRSVHSVSMCQSVLGQETEPHIAPIKVTGVRQEKKKPCILCIEALYVYVNEKHMVGFYFSQNYNNLSSATIPFTSGELVKLVFKTTRSRM